MVLNIGLDHHLITSGSTVGLNSQQTVHQLPSHQCADSVDTNGEDMNKTDVWTISQGQLITEEAMTTCRAALPGVQSEFAFGCSIN
jgi:hypothetical protein